MTPLKKAIYQTLCYADIFDYPLTRSELHRFLISTNQQGPTLKVKSSKRLDLNGIGIKTGGYYHLPGRRNLINLRRSRARFSQLKYQKLARYLWIFKLIPWIKLVAVSGALAMNNSNAADDIDLLIVTAKNRLWLTRALLFFFPSRRRYHLRAANKFCFNLWLDETALVLPLTRRNLYTAHELAQLNPMLNRHKTYQKLINANLWLLTFLPNWTI